MRFPALPVAIILILVSCTASAAMRLASFNIRHLGFNNDKDFGALAQIVSHFDLVAIQEVMNKAAVNQLEQALEQKTDSGWGSVTSDPVGRSSYREHYALVWRKSAVGFEGGAVQYLDPGDVFAREPLSATFRDKGTGQVFTYGTVHIVFGDSKADRRPEIRELDDYHGWLKESFGHPVIIAGDFNMPPDDVAWGELKGVLEPMITLGATTLSPTDNRYASLYDNIWLDPRSFDVTSRGIADYPTWLAISHAKARGRVSDHAPIFVTFGDVRVDTSSTQPSRAILRAEDDVLSCVDINTADVAELDTLPQVGPSRASDIIAGRPWASVGALTGVDGLSGSRMKAIKQMACPMG